MSDEVLVLGGSGSPLTHDRCVRTAAFLRRLAGHDDGPVILAARAVADALATLAHSGRIHVEPGDANGMLHAMYVASHDQVEVLRRGALSGWKEAIDKRQQKAIRTSVGALFRFPFESGDGHIDVFITDWSPSPGACAVAVHRFHPAVPPITAPGPNWFTGTYVRHPLTGDLLPVWVADWVKPDFGTGAVLVNPAHDRVDLVFGRAVGLPIRFALVPHDFDGMPRTWPAPPVIKSGRTIKTGPFDGLSVDEAMDAFFTTLAENGLAKRWVDLKVPAFLIAQLDPVARGTDSLGRLKALLADGRGTTGAQLAEAFNIEPAPALEAAVVSLRSVAATIVSPRAEIDGELLCYRLLLGDLSGSSGAPARVQVVGDVQLTKVEDSPDARLAAFLSNAIDEVAVVRPQQVEQIVAFARRHEELIKAQPADTDGEPDKVARGIEHALENDNITQAFSQLGKWQKQLLADENGNTTAALQQYRRMTFLLTGMS